MSKKKKGRTRSSPPAESSKSGSARENRNRADQFNPDYTYVMQDLRRIGTLAAIFITILVVLSIFLS